MHLLSIQRLLGMMLMLFTGQRVFGAIGAVGAVAGVLAGAIGTLALSSVLVQIMDARRFPPKPVKDASRAVGVARRLTDPVERQKLQQEVTEDYAALQVASTILGGGFLNSRIADRLRLAGGNDFFQQRVFWRSYFCCSNALFHLHNKFLIYSFFSEKLPGNFAAFILVVF